MTILPAWTQSSLPTNTIWNLDAFLLLDMLPSESVNCVVTSPPYYGLRDYGAGGQLGLEDTPEAYIENLVQLFRKVRRVLRHDGVVWLNLGDSYWSAKGQSGQGEKEFQQLRNETGKSFSTPAAHVGGRGKTRPTDKSHPLFKGKDAMLLPHRVAIALQADGWYLRMDSVWAKPNGIPESVRDRPTKSHEYVFLLSKSKKYWYDAEAIKKEAKEASVMRQKRGRSASHKNVAGVPGQVSHTLHTPKPNDKQAQVGNRRYDGFNERYENTLTLTANQRSVWDVAHDSDDLLLYLMQHMNQTYLDTLLTRYLADSRNADSLIRVSPEQLKFAHFAAFPRQLVEPMILAGCPERVCCACGTPWKRVTKAGKPHRSGGKDGNKKKKAVGPMDRGGKGQWDLGAMPTTRPLSTIGWQPTCTCNAGTRPGICLDPFMGSGTVALTARANGRDYVGSEINSAYIDIARERLRVPFEPHYLKKETVIDDLPLFQQLQGA